jgi:hypothetical protein
MRALCKAISNAGFSTILRDSEMDVIIPDNDQDASKWDRLTLEINAGIISNSLYEPSPEFR